MPGSLVVGVSYPSVERTLVYSTAQADWITGHLWVRVLPLLGNAVSVFYSRSRLDHRTLVVSEGLTPLRKCSLCILKPKLTGSQDTYCEQWSYTPSEMQSVYSTVQADWITGHLLWVRVLPLFENAVCVFCSPSRLGCIQLSAVCFY